MTTARKLAPSHIRRKARSQARKEHRVGSGKPAKAALVKFSAELKAARGTHSQESVADAVGISIQQYSNIERGINWPSMPVYLKLCSVMGVAQARMIV